MRRGSRRLGSVGSSFFVAVVCRAVCHTSSFVLLRASDTWRLRVLRREPAKGPAPVAELAALLLDLRHSHGRIIEWPRRPTRRAKPDRSRCTAITIHVGTDGELPPRWREARADVWWQRGWWRRDWRHDTQRYSRISFPISNHLMQCDLDRIPEPPECRRRRSVPPRHGVKHAFCAVASAEGVRTDAVNEAGDLRVEEQE